MRKYFLALAVTVANLFPLTPFAEGLPVPGYNPYGPKISWLDLDQASYFAIYRKLGGSQTFINKNIHLSDQNPVRRPRLLRELHGEIEAQLVNMNSINLK
jgi:hypothetical protein